MRPIYSRRVKRLPYYKGTYKGGTVIMTRSNLPDNHWVKTAFLTRQRRKTKRRRRK